MNVITVVSCKAGTGKTTLTAELAAYACRHGRRCLVIDADPHGGFAQLNRRRAQGALPLATARVLERQIEVAELLGYDWVMIDTEPAISRMVEEAVRLATMAIIPARPGLLDLADVSRTAELVHGSGTPYAVVLNSVPMQCARGGRRSRSRARGSSVTPSRCGRNRSASAQATWWRKAKPTPARSPRSRSRRSGR